MIRTLLYVSKRRVRAFIERSPGLFLILHRLWSGYRNRAVTRATHIVVEGFPRSANSFVYAALSKDNPDLILAHHLHSAANVLIGTRMGKPTVVLVRPPRDAVLSFVALHIQAAIEGAGKKEFSAWMVRALLSQALDEYVRFYTIVQPVRDKYLVVAFDEVTHDFGAVVERINARFGLSLAPFLHSAENQALLFSEGGFHLSPSICRDRIKRETSAVLDEPELARKLRIAEAAYSAMLPHEPATSQQSFRDPRQTERGDESPVSQT